MCFSKIKPLKIDTGQCQLILKGQLKFLLPVSSNCIFFEQFTIEVFICSSDLKPS